ncbi:MAG: cyclase family protein [Lachnospiraceae bacterium]|nr:cyclase family protein [Lachnospiraceae bacterium]
MMIYDISQEVVSCNVFPGDPSPEAERMLSIQKGDMCNLTRISMCAHNGTHVDAPYHFLDEGKTLEQISLDAFVGDCFVVHHEGDVTAKDAREILIQASALHAQERILIGGKATVTAEAAKVFAEEGIKLIGNESQTVGPENAPKEVHLILLGAEVVLLEGLVLSHVPEGKYLLSAAPLNLAGADGAPCRAILIE